MNTNDDLLFAMISDKSQTNSHYDEIDDTQLVELEDIVSVPRVADGGSFQPRVTELTDAVDNAIDDFKSQRSSVDESQAPHRITRAFGSTFEDEQEKNEEEGEEEEEEVEEEEEAEEEEEEENQANVEDQPRLGARVQRQLMILLSRCVLVLSLVLCTASW